MNQAEKAYKDIRTMDELAAMKSPVHSMNALIKLIITIIYIGAVTSFDRYNLTGLFVMILFPVIWYRISNIDISICFNRLRYIIPVVCLVGIANPFMDRKLWGMLGNVPVSCGMVSMITLAMKGIFCVLVSFLLIATTRIEDICGALRKIHCPKMITTLLLLTYRYIGILLEEVANMANAYALRAPGQKGIRVDAWGSFLGQLILRSIDRAQIIYESMLMRGFNGEYPTDDMKLYKECIVQGIITVVLIVLVRLINISAILGDVMLKF